jgi:hypothetical protein
MHLLGYPKPLRYLNLLLEWITRESSSSVVDTFFLTPTPDCIVRFDHTFRMRQQWWLEPNGGADPGERRDCIGGGASGGQLSQCVAEHIGGPDQQDGQRDE